MAHSLRRRMGESMWDSPAKAKEPSGWSWSSDMAYRSASCWRAPIGRRCGWRSRRWTLSVCGGHAGVQGGVQRNWSRIGDMIHTPVGNTGSSDRESECKAWRSSTRREAWDIVMFREGVRSSYPGVWIFERPLGYEWSPTPCYYLGGRRSGTFITM